MTLPRQADASALMGKYFLQMNMLPLAEREFRRAIKLDPSNVDGYLGMAQVKSQYALPKEAITFYEKAEKLG